MLNINLLPVRQLKARANAKKQLGLIGVLALSVLLLCAVIGFWKQGNISTLEAKKQNLKQENEHLLPLLKELQKQKKKKAELQRKMAIIKKLRQDSPLTVRILDEVANNLDNQRMWLTSLEQQDSKLTLSGIALDNQTVAQFMNNLATSKFVRDVALEDSSLTVVSGRNLKRFSLKCAIAYPGKEGEEEKKMRDAEE